MADTVPILSVTTPLGALGTVTTTPVILGQYVSLTVFVSADTDTTVSFQFTNDPTITPSPWVTISKSFGAGLNDYESTPVIAKWVRLSVAEASGAPQTRLSVTVYGTPVNNSVSAKIEKIGNKDPEVRVSNFPVNGFGDIQVAEMYPLAQYVFAGAGASAPQTTVTPLVSYYPSLTSTRFGTAAGARYSFPAATGNIRLDNGTGTPPPGVQHDRISGTHSRYRAGIPIRTRFTARWGSVLDVFNNPSDVIYMIAGVTSVNATGSMFALGWYFPAGYSGAVMDSAANFGILWRDGWGGALTFVPRASWNGDKADGTTDLPLIDPQMLNIFEINMVYLGGAFVEFRMLSPVSRSFVTIHTLTFANARTTTWSNEPSMAFSLEYYSNGAAYTSLGTMDFSVESGSAATMSCGSRDIGSEELHASDASVTTVAATETLVLALRNGDGAAGNLIPASLDSFSFASDGAKPVVFRIYGKSVIAAGAFSAVSGFTPVQKSTTGTLSSGRLLGSYSIGAKDNLLVEKHGVEIHMEPDEIIVVTATSPNITDAFVSVTFHLE